MKLHFKTIMQINIGNPYVLVTAAQATKLKKDWHKPMPVLVQINGQPDPAWHINMMPIGDGSFYLYLHGSVRKASKTKVGDLVTVDVDFDKAYRNGPMHDMPDWFEVALHENTTALSNWEALPPSRQKEVLRYFSWLKSEEARDRNLEQVMHVLSGHKGRFMARDWQNGK